MPLDHNGVMTQARVEKFYILVFTNLRMENTKTSEPVKDTKEEKVEKVEKKQTENKKIKDNK